MKLGVVFPQTEIGSDVAVLRDYVQTTEGLGYDYLLLYDHVVGANPERPGGWKGPYTYREQFHESFVFLAWVAALTTRLELVTGILILPQRQTVLVAKQAAEIDVLSGGRLRLGVGLGWNAVEFEALNENFNTRGKRLEEQVQVMRLLWKYPLVTFRGEHHTISDAGLNPLPVQRPIPVWAGGYAEAALRRIARIADGWMAGTMQMEPLRAAVTTMRQYVEEAGRPTKDFGIDLRLSMKDSPEGDWQAILQQCRDLQATHVSINTMGMGLSPREHIEAITRFKQAVG